MWSVLLRRAVFGVGPVATAQAFLRQLRRRDRQARGPSAERLGPHPFDVEFGVETGGFLSWRELQSGGANDPYISGYLGVAPSVGRRLIGLVERPEQFVFVDLGCGKGRATILASERPFRHIIGVEIAQPLAAVAQDNAARIARRFPERPKIEIVRADAALFELPPEPLVLFLYQPFERPVMRRVLAGLTRSLAITPRAVVLIYVYPELARMVDGVPALRRLAEGDCALIEEDRPFSYAGRADRDPYVVWSNRQDSATSLI